MIPIKHLPLPSSVHTDHMGRAVAAWAACRSLGSLHTLPHMGISYLYHYSVSFSFTSTPSAGLVGSYTWQIANKSLYIMSLHLSGTLAGHTVEVWMMDPVIL